MRLITEQVKRLAYRSQFYLDVPGLVQLLKFKQLRKEYYQGLWRQAAEAVGAEYADWDFGFARISKGPLATFVKNGSVMLDDHLTLDIAGNKLMIYRLMRELGYSVPRHHHARVADLGTCEAFLEGCTTPVVVKPASGTGGGRGVTTGIVNRRDLRKALKLAASFDTDLIVEEQLEGHSFRLLYINGHLVDAVRRDPPVITGDGLQTIRQLVAQENARRLKASPYVALSPLKFDRDCHNKLRAQGASPRTRLAAGEVFQLKGAVNENCSLGNHNVIDEIHADTVSSAARLVNKLGIKLAGIDIICRDISEPLGPDNGLITEVNTTPGLHHHYLVAEHSTVRPVAEYVLEQIFNTQQGVIRTGGVGVPTTTRTEILKGLASNSSSLAA